jgi:hypothetical protein
MLSLRRWRAPHLLGAWIAYWVLLALVALGKPLTLMRQVGALPKGRSSANLGFGDQGFTGKIVADGATLWETNVPVGTVVAWIVIPPLLVWVAWLLSRPRPTPVQPDDRPPELRAPDPVLDPERERERAERRR